EMAWQETFWAHGFGKVTDKFGVPWMINVVKQQPTQ
ncbi:TPA: VOC family protein, partial [Escherichia coli]|nr:VOC family protein [Escherichia coli]HAH0924364.1 VOC family protein [Escherichia coli]